MKKIVRRHARRISAALAGVLVGGEAVVNFGVNLPGSDIVPVWARLAAIAFFTVGAFFARSESNA